MSGCEALIEEVACTLSREVKAYDIPKVTEGLGMIPGDGSEAFASKKRYVVKRLGDWPADKVLAVAKRVQELFPDESLQQMIEAFDSNPPFPISPITRQSLFSCMSGLPPLNGKLGAVEFLEQLWPLRSMRASGNDLRCLTAYDEVNQHMVLNDDYSCADMLGYLGLTNMSNRKLIDLLEWTVHPLVRTDSDQCAFVDALNEHLKQDGLVLVASDQMSGYPVFTVVTADAGVRGPAKNLIFASTGPKPEIVLSDAINNDIQVVKNEEYCLVYDRPLKKEGLLWTHLVAWWAERNSMETSEQTERNLYSRLADSLASPPEKLLFRTYFKLYRTMLGERLPALVPQVYLHYDPYTLQRLGGQQRLARQRMDFLLLLSSFERIVIEVDGQQHYSDQDRPSPRKYAQMACADRDLRLQGYEVYRFGGAELTTDAAGQRVTSDFFTALFRKHRVQPSGPQPSSDQE